MYFCPSDLLLWSCSRIKDYILHLGSGSLISSTQYVLTSMDPADLSQLQITLDQQEFALGQHQNYLASLTQPLQSLSANVTDLLTTFRGQPIAPPGSSVMVTSAPRSVSGPCLQPLDKYSGEPGTSRDFLMQCKIIFQLQPRTFPSEAYVITQLSSRAKMWGSAMWEEGTLAARPWASSPTRWSGSSKWIFVTKCPLKSQCPWVDRGTLVCTFPVTSSSRLRTCLPVTLSWSDWSQEVLALIDSIAENSFVDFGLAEEWGIRNHHWRTHEWLMPSMVINLPVSRESPVLWLSKPQGSTRRRFSFYSFLPKHSESSESAKPRKTTRYTPAPSIHTVCQPLNRIRTLVTISSWLLN